MICMIYVLFLARSSIERKEGRKEMERVGV
jgi:hypothetical protein